MKMTYFIIINFNEIQKIPTKMKKEVQENYNRHAQSKQVHQVFLSYTTDQTVMNIQRIVAGQITLLANVI